MPIEQTPIEGAVILRGRAFPDDRGFFYEGYNARAWQEAGLPAFTIAQENQAFSHAGVLRGMHYQGEPDPQAKLVMCTRGAIYDVIVDIRPSSPSFMKWFGIELKGGDAVQFFIPAGCLHGYYALEDSEMRYLVNYPWNKAAEGSVRWNDPALGIEWPLRSGEAPILSQKDAEAPLLSEIVNPFAA